MQRRKSLLELTSALRSLRSTLSAPWPRGPGEPRSYYPLGECGLLIIAFAALIAFSVPPSCSFRIATIGSHDLSIHLRVLCSGPDPRLAFFQGPRLHQSRTHLGRETRLGQVVSDRIYPDHYVATEYRIFVLSVTIQKFDIIDA